MTSQVLEKVRKMTVAGVRQRQIARIVGVHRNSIFRAQRKLRLSACQPLPTATRRRIRYLLRRKRWGTSRIAKHLGISEYQVREIAKRSGFERRPGEIGWRSHLSPDVYAKLVDEIQRHQNPASEISRKYGLPHKLILRLAHAVLGSGPFRTGVPSRTAPLSSDWPQREKPAVIRRE